MNERSVRVRVPATSANLGPGFDALGVACTLYNEMTLTLTHEKGLHISARGEGAAYIPGDERNIVWKSIQYLLQRADRAEEFQGAKIRMNNRIPLSRGLGSSATAIVAGLTAANAIVGSPFSRDDLLQLATDIEGHPDNVAPAIFGGFTVNTVTNGHVECFSFLPRIFMRFVVMVPDFYLSTKSAREVLPSEVPMKDAVFNVSHAAMMVAALARGSEKHLGNAFEDALHQNYRASLIPGMFDVFAAAKKARPRWNVPCWPSQNPVHSPKTSPGLVRTRVCGHHGPNNWKEPTCRAKIASSWRIQAVWTPLSLSDGSVNRRAARSSLLLLTSARAARTLRLFVSVRSIVEPLKRTLQMRATNSRPNTACPL